VRRLAHVNLSIFWLQARSTNAHVLGVLPQTAVPADSHPMSDGAGTKAERAMAWLLLHDNEDARVGPAWVPGWVRVLL
jgi:hypothetical protein